MTKSKDKGAEYRAKIEFVRTEYLCGYITLQEAKQQLEPVLNAMNAAGRKIAKEYGKTYKPITFSYVFR